MTTWCPLSSAHSLHCWQGINRRSQQAESHTNMYIQKYLPSFLPMLPFKLPHPFNLQPVVSVFYMLSRM